MRVEAFATGPGFNPDRPVPAGPSSEVEGQAFAGDEDLWPTGQAGGFDLQGIELVVGAAGIMVEKGHPAAAGHVSQFDGLSPGRVAPVHPLLDFLGQELGVVDQQIGSSGQFQGGGGAGSPRGILRPSDRPPSRPGLRIDNLNTPVDSLGELREVTRTGPTWKTGSVISWNSTVAPTSREEVRDRTVAGIHLVEQGLLQAAFKALAPVDGDPVSGDASWEKGIPWMWSQWQWASIGCSRSSPRPAFPAIRSAVIQRNPIPPSRLIRVPSEHERSTQGVLPP